MAENEKYFVRYMDETHKSGSNCHLYTGSSIPAQVIIPFVASSRYMRFADSSSGAHWNPPGSAPAPLNALLKPTSDESGASELSAAYSQSLVYTGNGTVVNHVPPLTMVGGADVTRACRRGEGQPVVSVQTRQR